MTHNVSIIIPAYNEEKYLPLLLDSISKLDWPKEKLEVIVVDNGSTDNTCGIAESYGTLLLQDRTKNVSGLRNLGAKHATGDILAFVDADCVVSGGWLRCASHYFNDPAIAAWGSPPDIPENATWVQRSWLTVRRKEKPVEDVDWLESMNLFIRKDIFQQAGEFDETLVTCEDVDICYRILKFGRIVADASIAVVHLGEAATIRAFARKELWRGRGNFQGVFNHGLSFKEMPSLAIPIYFGIFIPFMILFFILSHSTIVMILSIAAIGFPIVAAMYKMRRKKTGLIQKIQLAVLLYIYFAVRTVAVVPLKNG